MKYFRNDSHASDPINIRLSKYKMKELRPDLFGLKRYINMFMTKILNKRDLIEYFQEHVFYGDSQPAVVVSLYPLKIATYSDELDCVAILIFPDYYIKKYCLELNTRLLTINTYISKPPFQEDLIIGPSYLERWYGFSPIIAEFISDDMSAIKKRKDQIPEEMWEHIQQLGFMYIESYPNSYRDGRPGYSIIPSKL